MKASKNTSTSHKYAELLALALFYKQTQPNVRTLDLLKIMGFEIKGLQRRFRAFLPDPRPHLLVWNPTLQWGICLCGKWEIVDSEENRAKREQKIHLRLASRLKLGETHERISVEASDQTKYRRSRIHKWRNQHTHSGQKTLTNQTKEE